MFNSANCLGYAQLDTAFAFRRDEGTENKVQMGVHPATYGTDYYGRHRATLPPINDDIPFDDLFGGVEDRLIATIDGDAADVTGAPADHVGSIAAEAAELQSIADECEDLYIPRRDRLMLQQHELNQMARGDAYAAKKGGSASTQPSTPTVLHISITAVAKAETSPRSVGLRKEAAIADAPVARRDTPRSWKHQASAAPKQFLRLADFKRIR